MANVEKNKSFHHDAPEKKAAFMQKLIEDYESMRGKNLKEAGIAFWDLVVISAGDEEQKNWFEQLLQFKLQHGELPVGVPYRVFSDPGDTRTGDGGATLNILSELRKEFGSERLFCMRILLIHAGGFSKRLPSHSCTGKIFSPVPVRAGRKPYQMLDMKLLMYVPFVELMGPGVFVTPSDDLEAYNADPGDFETFRQDLEREKSKQQPLVCALAHTSSLFIGTGHGVFLLPKEMHPVYENSTMIMSSCVEVLQKPSIEKMRQKGMVLKDADDGKEYVYSDGSFWLNQPVMKRLLDFFDREQPIDVETSMYSDFMVCQGTSGDKDHIRTLLGQKQAGVKAVEFKLKVWHLMQDVALKVVVLPHSKYYHFGTLEEYHEEFCSDQQLAREMKFHRLAFSKFIDRDEEGSIDHIQGVVTNSLLPSSLAVPKNVVIEYSLIENPSVVLEDRTIISNCHIAAGFDKVLPGHFVYHTIPIHSDACDEGAEGELFVTVAFHTKDDFKTSVEDVEKLQLGGKSMSDIFECAERIKNQDLFLDDDEGSLWSAKLFPTAKSMAESFEKTICMIRGDPKQELNGGMRYSMDELMKRKDKARILEYRRQMYVKIAA